MSGSPYQYVDSTGVIVADTTDIKSTVQAEWISVFGNDLDLDDATPEGVMIVAETLARSNVVKNNAAVANQINPNEAGGRFLDAIGGLSELERAANTFSTYINVVLAGQPSTPVPQNTPGTVNVAGVTYTFLTASAVTLDSVTGQALVNMVANVAGPIVGPAGSLMPDNSVLGLETITAPTNASLGVVEQSDVSFRALRRNTLALQGISLNMAITSALSALNGVLSLKYQENIQSTAQTINGIAMNANSVWACVDGGTNTDIANALLVNKSTGSGWTGAVSVATVDPSTGQSYNVLFDRPTYVPMLIRVTARQGNFVGSLSSAISNAVLAFGSNTVSENTSTDLGIVGFVVGSDVSPFEIAGAIQAQVPGCKVSKVEVSTVAANSYQTTDIVFAINQKATVTVGNISVLTS
jgi:hypothetical protein